MELNSFLQNKREDGTLLEDSSFTLNPKLARRKLAESVPEKFAEPWAAVGFLRSGFALAGLKGWGDEGGVSPAGRMETSFSSHVTKCALAYTTTHSAEDWDPAEFRLALEDAASRPFGDRTPLGICLSRAFLVLARVESDVRISFPGYDLADVVISNGRQESEELRQLAEQASQRVPKGVVCVFPAREDWSAACPSPRNSQYDPKLEQRRARARLLRECDAHYLKPLFYQKAIEKPANFFGFHWEKPSVWTHAPGLVALELLLDFYGKGSWYDYRCNKVVLLEHIELHHEETPLVVNTDVVGPQGELLQRPGEHMTSWERYRSRGEDLILRSINTTPSKNEGLLHARAVFAIGLFDAGSQVTFMNWGSVREKFPIPNCPAGLAAVVWWPELKQGLYGDSWVKDEAFEEAMAWVEARAAELFDVLRNEFDYVWQMMVRDHVKTSCVPEVRRRVCSWLGVEQK
jgi:hypothetical protein